MIERTGVSAAEEARSGSSAQKDPATKVARDKRFTRPTKDNPAFFTYRKIFPDVTSIFSWEQASVETLVREAIVILDANVLLHPLRTNHSSIEGIAEVYEKLAAEDRIIIPAQAAREYAMGRSKEFVNLHSRLHSLNNYTQPELRTESIVGSEDEIKKLQGIRAQIKELTKQYSATKQMLVDRISDWHFDDAASRVYKRIFVDRIRESEKTEEQIKEIFLERLEQDLPPGLKDQGKRTNPEGDVVIWLTILEVGKQKNSHCILVTTDLDEADWAYPAKHAKLALYTRPELIEEYRNETQGKTFRVMDFPTFLEKFGASVEVVNSVSAETSTNLSASRIYVPAADRSYKVSLESSRLSLELYVSIESTPHATLAHFSVHKTHSHDLGWVQEVLYSGEGVKLLTDGFLTIPLPGVGEDPSRISEALRNFFPSREVVISFQISQ